MSIEHGNWSRRTFVKSAGLLTTLGITDSLELLAAEIKSVTIVVDPKDTIASSDPCKWAASELERALTEQQIRVGRADTIASAPAGDLCVLIASVASPAASSMLQSSGATAPAGPESLAVVSGTKQSGKSVVLATGTDNRGLMYAVLEVVDRVRCSDSPSAALTTSGSVVEAPANKLRSINRCFQSDIEDKPWFEDKEMWSAYLTMLATHRFNMFNLSMGLAYDYPQKVFDSYTYFTYPFFVRVPGYDQVKAGNLTDEQREKNLEILRFVSEQCAQRGIDFTLGLWNHAYVMSPGSKPTYPILGLTPETHAPYCRDALYTLLESCPGITGITMRVHGESGIPEGNFNFWEVVFQGIAKLDRKINVNLHAKGTSDRIINIAQSTKMPVSLTPKYWAEHLGLPYQPSSIRETEKPLKGPDQKGALFELSNGARRFMRYSYGDLFKKDRTYDVYFRIWPGTQRVLLWGDPKLAAGDGRGFPMCGSLGVDLFEPLSFKGRASSGISSAPGGRCSYQDQSLAPKYDWDKFAYSYRVWGRYIYNPDSDPKACTRYWDKQLKAAGARMAEAVALGSRILRIVTTSQDPSAANWTYWPEIYTNMTIVDESLNKIYRDTPEPKVYGAVSPLDPQMFVAINSAVDEMLDGKSNPRYSPMEVARWLDDYSTTIDRDVAQLSGDSRDASSPVFRRAMLDVQILSGLGHFYAAKIRSASYYRVYQRTGDATIKQQAVAAYRKSLESWTSVATLAKGKYMDDITYGGIPNMRGCWADRTAAIAADIDAMEKAPAPTPGSPINDGTKQAVLRQIALASPRPSTPCDHRAQKDFHPGSPMTVQIKVPSSITAVRLVYRHVNQAEYYETADMKLSGAVHTATIPAEYTNSPYALQYYFELQHSPTQATMFPGLGPDLTQRPYFLVEQKSAHA
jgi:hypothetical protein